MLGNDRVTVAILGCCVFHSQINDDTGNEPLGSRPKPFWDGKKIKNFDVVGAMSWQGERPYCIGKKYEYGFTALSTTEFLKIKQTIREALAPLSLWNENRFGIFLGDEEFY